MRLPEQGLVAAQLVRRCAVEDLEFESTEELGSLTTVIGQPRALEAIDFAIAIQGRGYNLYALGTSGTGKATTIRKFLVSGPT
jgi:ABC-type transporter Mla maintaining outer membrane lipid asymmetry ATPase subunit MlaF